MNADEKALAVRRLEVFATGSLADFEQIYHPDAVNHEAKAEPADCRGRGPAAMFAASQWLRSAFSDLSQEVVDVAAEGDLAAINTRMRGRHTGTYIVYTAEGDVEQAFPATGKSFDVRQTHWLRVVDGKVTEHWADRDDLGMAKQAGWVPPTPLYLLRMALAKRRAQRG